LQTDKIFAVLIVIGVIGVAMDVGFRLLRNRSGPVGQEPAMTSVGRLETVNLVKEYPTRSGPLRVLDAIDVHAEPGEFVPGGLVGVWQVDAARGHGRVGAADRGPSAPRR